MIWWRYHTGFTLIFLHVLYAASILKDYSDFKAGQWQYIFTNLTLSLCRIVLFTGEVSHDITSSPPVPETPVPATPELTSTGGSKHHIPPTWRCLPSHRLTRRRDCGPGCGPHTAAPCALQFSLHRTPKSTTILPALTIQWSKEWTLWVSIRYVLQIMWF